MVSRAFAERLTNWVDFSDNVSKHLLGQHDQSTHGRGKSSSFDSKSYASYKDNEEKFMKAMKELSAINEANGLPPLDEEALKFSWNRYQFRSLEHSEIKGFDRMNKEAQEFIANHPISVFMPAETLSEVLDDGAVKSIFELTDLKDEDYLAARSMYEKIAYGYDSENLPNDQRPISGAVTLDAAGAQDYLIETYGTVRVILKDEVKERSTFTIDDSLDNFAKPVGFGEKFPPTVSYMNTASDMGFYHRTADPDANYFEWEDWHYSHYMEAQVHGGIKVSDIAKVIFTDGDEFYKGYGTKLDKLGIPYEVNE